MKEKLKVGDLCSVWARSTRHHKWLREYSLVLIRRLNGKSVTVQTSESGRQRRAPGGMTLQTGNTSFVLSDCRELRKADLI